MVREVGKRCWCACVCVSECVCESIYVCERSTKLAVVREVGSGCSGVCVKAAEEIRRCSRRELKNWRSSDEVDLY